MIEANLFSRNNVSWKSFSSKKDKIFLIHSINWYSFNFPKFSGAFQISHKFTRELNSYHSFQKSALKELCLFWYYSITRVKTRIHFTCKQNQGKKKRQEDWQVKSIIYVKVQKVQSDLRCTVPICSTPFSASQYRLQNEHQSPQQPAKFWVKWPYQARWSQTHFFLTLNQRTEVQGRRWSIS